ncbi:MAG: chemotaxis protein CheA [Candidatus Riflebacteria bacterium]|nr:chemotaxis protein CheA [Candidatus Riflebacteria bacterium]
MIDEYRKAFREEAADLLADLETALLELESDPMNLEMLGQVFRTMHTIKGSGSMFGFDDVAAFTHELETAFDLIRRGKVRVNKQLIDLTLNARDLIRAMIEVSFGGEPVEEARKNIVIEALHYLLVQGSVAGERQPEVSVAPGKQAGVLIHGAPELPGVDGRSEDKAKIEAKQVGGGLKTWRIRFKPAVNLFRQGVNPVLMLNELRELGDVRIIAGLDAIPELQDLDPEGCFISWDVLLTTANGLQSIRDVFIFVEDESEIRIDLIDEFAHVDDEGPGKRLGEILVDRGDLKKDDLAKVLEEHKKIGELLVESGAAGSGQVEAALLEQQHLSDLRKKKQAVEATSSIRVTSERLDSLVNLIGELVTVQARLSQTAASRNDPELLAIGEVVERLTADLRDSALNIRMMPIGATFSKFRRLVRDLSTELGREIELITDGAETELDKTVIEKLNDLLVHLIRNSIDHGIEPPEERENKGKSRSGHIHLSAMHSGAQVLVQIRDDGRGLDREAIRTKAIERGLVQPNAEVTDKELFSLIFLPGFSTAKKVTNVSGRGVGLDVVKRAIDELRGSIDVASQPDIGSEITLKLPLTLAIIDGLLVRISDRSYVLPLSVVRECVELKPEDVARGHGKHVAIVRGEMVPYVRLRERFGIGGPRPNIEQIVITEVEGLRVGFVVDHVIGEHQTVIKTLGSFYKDVEGLSGATILGDGSVALIMDIGKLIQSAEREEVSRV